MGFWNREGKISSTALFSWSDLARISRKGPLLVALKEKGRLYSPDDLELMLTRYAKKLENVPKEYGDALLHFARIQIIDGYHQMMTDELADVHAAVPLFSSWKGFTVDAQAASAKGTSGDRLRSLKYLIAAYTVFIREEPVHPVGMPFPGGFSVEQYDGEYYCPVRAVWNDIDDAFCKYCPAVQSRERDLLLSKAERDNVTKKEKLNNYFYNFKG
ncbi:MAG TPA: DUF2115 domain-containing protein [Methanocorpusculum sp.]|nr:DUF2115 domain-containing protein [Methanocorpusculum sp.]HJJ53033.1 DUF2115 domain-containing protein [Methanocorpusculum sp.]